MDENGDTTSGSWDWVAEFTDDNYLDWSSLFKSSTPTGPRADNTGNLGSFILGLAEGTDTVSLSYDGTENFTINSLPIVADKFTASFASEGYGYLDPVNLAPGYDYTASKVRTIEIWLTPRDGVIKFKDESTFTSQFKLMVLKHHRLISKSRAWSKLRGRPANQVSLCLGGWCLGSVALVPDIASIGLLVEPLLFGTVLDRKRGAESFRGPYDLEVGWEDWTSSYLAPGNPYESSTPIHAFILLRTDLATGESVVLLDEGRRSFGWKRAGWFGFYFADLFPWVYHQNLGWLFVAKRMRKAFGSIRSGWVGPGPTPGISPTST